MPERIPSLDGLRAVSVALVVLSHIFIQTTAVRWVDPGNLGVRVFFVISGFLITGLLLRELEGEGRIDLPRFYFRRTLRIFPPFYAYLAFVAVITAAGRVPAMGAADFLPAAGYVSNYLLTPWAVAHSWSLSVEEQFYLLWPGIIFLAGRRRAFAAALLCVAAGPALRLAGFYFAPDSSPVWTRYGFHVNADALAVGCLLAFARGRLHADALYLRLLGSRLTPLVITPLVLAGGAVRLQNKWAYYGLVVSLMNVSVALLIDWAVTRGERGGARLLNSRPAVAVGLCSYSIYLWQQLFLLNPSGAANRYPLLNLLLVALFSAASYFTVERGSHWLRRRLERRRRTVPAGLRPSVRGRRGGEEARPLALRHRPRDVIKYAEDPYVNC